MTGAEFKRLRESAGLTLTEAAAAIGVNRATVARWQHDAGLGAAHNIPILAVEILERIAEERMEPAKDPRLKTV